MEARDLAALVERLTADPTGLVFLDGTDRVGGSPAEYLLQEAITSGGLRMVATADYAAARSYDPTIKAIRTRGDVLLLQPDPDSTATCWASPSPGSPATSPRAGATPASSTTWTWSTSPSPEGDPTLLRRSAASRRPGWPP